MHSLFALALAVFGGQEFDKAKAEFRAAVAQMSEYGVREAAAKLAKSDNKEAVDALLDGYGLTAGQLKQLWAEKVRWIREMDANSDIEWETGQTGSRPAPNSITKFQKLTEAQRKGKEVEDRIQRVEGVKRHIVAALATFKSDAAVKELLAKMKNDSSWDRRAGVAEALGRIDHAESVPALVAQLKKDTEAAVKVACLDALAAKKSSTAEAVAAICEQLAHEFWQVKFSAAMALKAIGSKDAIEPIIEALKGVDGRLKHDFNDVLIALAGVDKHGDYGAWRAWWDANAEQVKGGSYQPKDGEKPGAGGDRGTTFYGIPVKSKNVIFVLDRSGSMMWDSEWKYEPEPEDVSTGAGGGKSGGEKYPKPDGDRKIDVARWQLKRCLSRLPDGTEFNLIFFNTSFEVFAEKMVKMTPATRQTAIAFVDRLVPEGGTNIYDPMERAFSIASAGELKDKLAKSGADTIFLLTDGMPNSGQIPDANGILSKLKESNRLKKLVINTVGVFSTNPPDPRQANEKEDGEKFLKDLAEAHAGVFVNASSNGKDGKAGGGRKK